MHAPVRTVAPSAAVVSTAEARQACSIDAEVTEWDTMLEGLVAAATAYLDGWRGVLGRCIMPQTWRQDFDAWDDCLRLPFPQCTVSEVRWFAEGDATGTVVAASGNYDGLEDELGSYVRLRSGFTAPGTLDEVRGVRVTFTAALPADDLAVVHRVVLMLVAHWFANREAVNVGSSTSVLPFGAEALISAVRRIRV